MSVLKIVWVVFVLIIAQELKAQKSFPDWCIGKWSGTMKIYQKSRLVDSVFVELTVDKKSDSLWSWKTEYKSAKLPIVKDYTLKYVSGNCYKTDEGDGVELLNYCFDTKMYSSFETEGIVLTANYEMQGETLLFEVTSSTRKNTQNGVTNYSMDNVQKVVYRRLR